MKNIAYFWASSLYCLAWLSFFSNYSFSILRSAFSYLKKLSCSKSFSICTSWVIGVGYSGHNSSVYRIEVEDFILFNVNRLRVSENVPHPYETPRQQLFQLLLHTCVYDRLYKQIFDEFRRLSVSSQQHILNIHRLPLLPHVVE